MIYITGDIHGDPTRFSKEAFPEQSKMTKEDYVIVCGDFGLVWDQMESRTEEYWLNWLQNESSSISGTSGSMYYPGMVIPASAAKANPRIRYSMYIISRAVRLAAMLPIT
mgnify:CR=1 FL=1